MAGLTSSAMAEEPGEQCSGAGAPPAEHVLGEGSSLQKVAQAIWNDEESLPGKGFNNSEFVGACSGTQGSKAKPVVLYNSTGSGAGRLAWGAEESLNKALDGKKMNPAESGDAFIGTDEPLSESQIKNLDEAAEGTGQALVIPVEQAAVAVIVNLPENCLITKITNADLQKIWNGEITLWSEVLGGTPEAGVTEDVAKACEVEIERVVRKDVSGTTYVFKLYLSEINTATTCSGETWSFYAEPLHNLEWPQEPTVGCKGKVFVAAENGGGGEVKEVLALTGTIGYANLADARADFTDETGDHYHWLAVQNQRALKTFVEPGTSAGEPSLEAGESNCKETKYGTLPAVGPDDNWSAVNGAHPGSGTEKNMNYPICTLTYVVALVNYELADLTKSIATTAYNYLNYVVAPTADGGGQADIAGHDYLEVEEAVGKFAQKEARLIAGGTLILELEKAGLEIFSFEFKQEPKEPFEEEGLLLENAAYKAGAMVTYTPAVGGGGVDLSENGCSTVEIKGTCLFVVTALVLGLIWITDWFQWWLHISIP
jgi:ABC-type phosphate transport system substrate-binding protein